MNKSLLPKRYVLFVKFSLLNNSKLTKTNEEVRYLHTKKVGYIWLVNSFEMTCEMYHHERTMLGI